MKRENLHKAQVIINMLEHLENVHAHVLAAKENNWLGYSGVTIKIADKLEYMFPDNVEFSMFYHILKSSLENEIDKYNQQLLEL